MVTLEILFKFLLNESFLTVSLAVLWYVAVFSIAAALPDCKQSYVELSPGKTAIVNNAGYPRGFLVKSGCKTKIAAPIYHKIDISCHIYIGVKSNQIKLFRENVWIYWYLI